MNQFDINEEESVLYQSFKYTWYPKKCLGVVYGMEIYRGWQEDLTNHKKERIIIKLYQNQDKEFEYKLRQISEVQKISGPQIIQVRQTLTEKKIIQVNDPYELTLHEQQQQCIQEQQELQEQLVKEYKTKKKEQVENKKLKAKLEQLQQQLQQEQAQPQVQQAQQPQLAPQASQASQASQAQLAAQAQQQQAQLAQQASLAPQAQQQQAQLAQQAQQASQAIQAIYAIQAIQAPQVQQQGQVQVQQQQQPQAQNQELNQQREKQEQEQEEEVEMINLENYKKYIWTQLDIIEQLEDVVATMHLMNKNQFIHGNINKQTIVFHNKKFHLAHFENYQSVDPQKSQNPKNYALYDQNYINPPENKLSVKSDVYQLGVVFYMMKTGHQEFKLENFKKYSIDPITLLIKRMTDTVENRCNSQDVYNGIQNIKNNQQLEGIYQLSQMNNHLLAWQFLFDAVDEFQSSQLLEKDYQAKQYLTILLQTIRYHQFKLEQYHQQINNNQFFFVNNKDSLTEIINQYYKLKKDTEDMIIESKIEIDYDPKMELQDLQMIQDRIQKPYFIKTLQLSNNIHDLFQLDQKFPNYVGELKLCFRLFFCLPLQYLHINIKERLSQYEDMIKLGYHECMMALEQQIYFYFQKLYDQN